MLSQARPDLQRPSADAPAVHERLGALQLDDLGWWRGMRRLVQHLSQPCLPLDAHAPQHVPAGRHPRLAHAVVRPAEDLVKDECLLRVHRRGNFGFVGRDGEESWSLAALLARHGVQVKPERRYSHSVPSQSRRCRGVLRPHCPAVDAQMQPVGIVFRRQSL